MTKERLCLARQDGDQVVELGVVVRCADTFLTRLRGLLGTRSLPEDQGLWIKPCAGIHTMWMLYTIDVVFLDANDQITGVAPQVASMRFRTAPKTTCSVLELTAGSIERLGLRSSDQLLFKK